MGDVMLLATEEANETWCCSHKEEKCCANNCMAWRWKPLMADDAWTEAVRKAAIDVDDKSHNRAKAAAHVNANRAAYGLPTKPYLGYCGLAGRPE